MKQGAESLFQILNVSPPKIKPAPTPQLKKNLATPPQLVLSKSLMKGSNDSHMFVWAFPVSWVPSPLGHTPGVLFHCCMGHSRIRNPAFFHCMPVTAAG